MYGFGLLGILNLEHVEAAVPHDFKSAPWKSVIKRKFSCALTPYYQILLSVAYKCTLEIKLAFRVALEMRETLLAKSV